MPFRQHCHLLACSLVVLCQAPLAAQSFSEAEYEFLEEPVSGEVDVRAQVRIGDSWSSDGLARIVFCYGGDADFLYLQMDANGAKLGEVREGKEQVLSARAGRPEPAQAGVYRIIIKRRSWAIRVLCDGQVILTAYDQFAPGERIGTAARGVKVEDLHAQPIGEMMFHDDFARPAGEPDPWETAFGSWKTRLPEGRTKKVQAANSANPFSYRATGQKALALAGSSFWDGYEVRAAVRPAADKGAVGLACYAQDKQNHYLFRATVKKVDDAGAGKAELLKVVKGKEIGIAEGVCNVTSGRWQELSVRAHDGRIEGLVDGEVICLARDSTFGEGRIGLYTENCPKALFDDIAVEPYRYYGATYSPRGALPIEEVAGQWSVYQDRLCGRPSGRPPAAIGLTGSAEWRDYAFAADILPWTATAVGLCFGWTGPDDYYLFRWGADGSDAKQMAQELCKVIGGRRVILAKRPAPLAPKTTHQVEVTLDRSYLCVSVDGERALEAVDVTRPSAGRVGYYVEGAPRTIAVFDNMRLRSLGLPQEPVSITEQFAKESLMADWARPAASWRSLGKGLYVYKLPVWGDFCLRAPVPGSTDASASWSVGLRLAKTKEALQNATACVTIGSERGKAGLTCKGDGGEAVTSAEGASLLEVERRGGCAIISLDGKAAAWARAPEGKDAPVVALKLEGKALPPNDVTLTSPNILDEAFSSAPTKWSPGAGLWQIGDRWHCQPWWAWFCGKEAETPLLWHKRTFTGDMVMEFWGAMMMDSPSKPHYFHPSDLNGIICGDGKHLCSGYAFVFAGDKNTKGKILRKGKTVAESAGLTFKNPNTGNGGFHNAWFHSRVEKTGNHLRFFVNGAKALEYEDPNPLAGGHVGIWTHQGNGILIARARIAFR